MIYFKVSKSPARVFSVNCADCKLSLKIFGLINYKHPWDWELRLWVRTETFWLSISNVVCNENYFYLRLKIFHKKMWEIFWLSTEDKIVLTFNMNCKNNWPTFMHLRVFLFVLRWVRWEDFLIIFIWNIFLSERRYK